MIIAISEAKPKIISKKITLQDFQIPGYTLHPTNLENGTGIAVYTHESINRSVILIQVDSKFEEACLLEIRLRGGDILLFGCIYRSPTTTGSSDQNNGNLNYLLKGQVNPGKNFLVFPDIRWIIRNHDRFQ